MKRTSSFLRAHARILKNVTIFNTTSPSLRSLSGVVVSQALSRPGPFLSFSSLGGQSRSLFVKIESTPNPDSLKFIPENREVLTESQGSGRQFDTVSSAKGSKLVRRLLKIAQVTSVFLGREFISVNKLEETSWAPLKPIVLDAIMDAYNELDSNKVPILDDSSDALVNADTRISPEDSEVVAMIKELLETRIRPAVQEDGGDIFYEGFDPDTGVVKVRMAGSCVGCPSSTATLRNGVENMLMHYIPEVKSIEQVKGQLETESEKELSSLEERLSATSEKN
jgi:NFU1 iron-sulfur cluster scaffold homolog, mitochondrial